MAATQSKTFVLLHGAWHGGWCWSRVAEALRSRGHKVTTPTQTGLGERRHLLSDQITLQTFIDDLVNHILAEDLNDAILVGHSFGGNGISGAAETLPERIRSLVYLDCTIIESGQRPVDILTRGGLADTIQTGLAEGNPGIAVPDPQSFGVLDAADRAWVAAHLTPHPLSTMTSPMPVKGQPGNGLPARYIMCTEPQYQDPARVADWANRFGWTVDEIATGHDAMVTAPEALTDMLDA